MNSIETKPFSLEDQFGTDFYDYLNTSENQIRYSQIGTFLRSTFRKEEFFLLDVACANGNLIPHLPKRCNYTGVDHNLQAIDGCKEKFSSPSKNFICSDIRGISELPRTYDVIVLSGVFWNTIDATSLEKISEKDILRSIFPVLKKNGYIILVTPFAYSDNDQCSLFNQAKWKRDCVYEVLSSTQDIHIVHENMSLLVGLEKQILKQKMFPDWFIANPKDFVSPYCGHYLGTWCIICKYT